MDMIVLRMIVIASLERRRGTIIAGCFAIAIEFANTLAVTLSGRSPIALPAGRYWPKVRAG